MNFRQLPIELQFKVAELAEDQQFQKRFNDDQVLNQLDQLKYDPVIEYNEVQLAFHNKLRFKRMESVKRTFLQKILFKKYSQYVQLEPVTLGLWAYLYTIKSPVVFTDQQLTTIDIDLFFYLLQEKQYNKPVKQLFTQSMDYCNRKMKISQEQAVQIITYLTKISFRVLNMFPRLQLEQKPVFNLDWLTSLVTKVKHVSSYSTQEIYKEIPVCEVYYLFAQYCRQIGSEAIYLRTEEEIMIEQDLRCSTLVVERLIELGHIDETNKTYYINLIHNIVGGKQ